MAKRIAQIILPMSGNKRETLADKHSYLRSELMAWFGGYTAYHTFGGWRGDDGKEYQEAGMSYHVAMDHEEYTNDRLILLASWAAFACKQECVMVIDTSGEVHFVDEEIYFNQNKSK